MKLIRRQNSTFQVDQRVLKLTNDFLQVDQGVLKSANDFTSRLMIRLKSTIEFSSRATTLQVDQRLYKSTKRKVGEFYFCLDVH